MTRSTVTMMSHDGITALAQLMALWRARCATIQMAGTRLRDEFVAPVSLRVERRGKIAVVDAGGGGGRDRGLGVVGDTEACRLDHAEIVGAVADRERIDLVEIKGLAQLDQGSELGSAADDRFA